MGQYKVIVGVGYLYSQSFPTLLAIVPDWFYKKTLHTEVTIANDLFQPKTVTFSTRTLI